MSKTHALHTVELFDQPFAKRTDWAYRPDHPAARPPEHSLDRKHGHKHLSRWTPKVESAGYPAAKQSGDRVAGSQLETTSKKLWRQWKPGDSEEHAIVTEDGAKLVPVLIEIIGDDGEPRLIQPKLIRNTLHLSVYGRAFTFTKCKNRGNSVLDSRDGKRKPLAWIQAELDRMLGTNAGSVAYAALVGA